MLLPAWSTLTLQHRIERFPHTSKNSSRKLLRSSNVFQFVKIARPGIVLQKRERLWSNAVYFLVDLGAGPQQKVLRKKRNILNPLASDEKTRSVMMLQS